MITEITIFQSDQKGAKIEIDMMLFEMLIDKDNWTLSGGLDGNNQPTLVIKRKQHTTVYAKPSNEQ